MVAAVGEMSHVRRLGRLDPAATRKLSHHVGDVLREALVGGRFRSGERLSERALAAELGVSTTPIKEALQRLQVDGLVRIEPRRGIYACYDARQAREMFLARAALESVIAGQAALQADAMQRAAMKQCCKEIDAATRSGNVKNLIALNGTLHGLIQDASGCRYLVALQRGLHVYESLARASLMRDGAEREAMRHEHRAIVAAIRARDAARAERLMREHVIRSGERHVAMIFAKEEQPT
jgi:DNA-binding GntR family transcriptional regulator